MSGHISTTIVGRVTEPKEIADGKALRLGVAVRKNSKENKDACWWHDVIIWNNAPCFEFVKKHVRKGSSVKIDGELIENVFTKADGTDATKLETRAFNVTFLPSSPNSKKDGNNTQETVEDVPTTEDFDMPSPEVDEDVPF